MENDPADLDGFAARVREGIGAARRNVDAFLALPAQSPFAEVIRAFDRLLQPLNGLAGRVELFIHAHPDAGTRAACEVLEQEIAAFRTELALNRDVYERLRGLADDGAPEDGRAEDRRLLERALRDYRRSGVDRDETTRERVRALQEELVRIGQEFERNIIEGGREHVVPDGHAGLAGLPADFLAAHPEREDGSVVLSSDPGDRIAVLTYAERADVRRPYFVTSMNRAAPENLGVLRRLFAQRHELARLLGYEHWADYVTEDKMTGSAAEARAFVERLIGLVRDRARAERDELLAALREDEPGATEVPEEDRFYLLERLKSARCGFDSQAARAYFAYEKVRDGLLCTSAELYGVRFRRDVRADVWHPSVECYEVLDGRDVVARCYLDMHPRAGKYKHAAMFHVTEGLAGETLPEATLLCNFPRPTEGDPALLLHEQVTTFFHEFGHLLHHLFAGRRSYLSFSGITTEHDFVEVPSQMYEEWAWSPEVLRTFALHHETGEPIPEDLVARMRAAEEYGKGLHVTLQMYLALLSLSCFDRDPSGVDPLAFSLELKSRTVPLRHAEGSRYIASFGHLNSYSAMYYTYMWSLVIAKDLFSRFESDLMSGATANEFRARVLEPGGSRDAKDLVRSFLGREYAYDAFERWLGR